MACVTSPHGDNCGPDIALRTIPRDEEERQMIDQRGWFKGVTSPKSFSRSNTIDGRQVYQYYQPMSPATRASDATSCWEPRPITNSRKTT